MKREIYDFTFKPIADRKRASAVFFGLVVASFLFVIPSVLLDKYQGVMSLAAVGLFIGAMAVYSRYLIGEYAYVVANCGDGGIMFIVTKTSGKRVSTLCNISLKAITDVRRAPAADIKKEKIENGVKRYNFCPSMSPEHMIVIEASSGMEKMKIYLEGTDALAARLLEDSRAAILNSQEEESE